jgi:hypothetical protein
MDIIQAFKRLGQRLSGWSYAIDMLYYQLPLIKKLYAKNGFYLKLTCSACPEQYEVYKDGVQVAYYRLKHGEFMVDYPECGGETIYESEPNGDGMFDDNERLVYLTKALRIVQQKLNNHQNK